MSTEPRTTVVNLLVTKSLEIDEPEWCVAPHDGAQFKPDVTHFGPEETLDFRGETLWTLLLAQSPYSTAPDARGLGLVVEQGSYTATLDPAGLDELAAALVEHAAVLRARARQLAALLAGSAQ